MVVAPGAAPSRRPGDAGAVGCEDGPQEGGVSCRFCGGVELWIKTCRTLSGEIVRCYDPCYGSLLKVLVIVPGPVCVW